MANRVCSIVSNLNMAKKDPINVKLGNSIDKKARIKYKSNVEFADVSNVAESTIRRILAGEQNITLKTIKQICDALDIKISELFEEIGE
jgi:DNA-binding Xre family transcriptional regulator